MVTRCAMFYAGIAAEGGGDFTLQGGITPSTAVFRFCLRETIPYFGAMVLTDGTLSSTFNNCRMVRYVVTEGQTGRWQEVTIEDRRWNWADGYYAIYGEYNRQNPPLERQANRASVAELAAKCLQALGEVNYNVSVMPTNIFPPVSWDGANPAAELQKLCTDYGFIVTITTADTVRICQEGVGVLPSLDPRMTDYNLTAEPPVIPAVFVVEGGRTHIHHDLPLVPVGYESDSSSDNYGKYVHIDALSYRPAGGWEFENPIHFTNVDAAYRNDAKKHVWRTYQFAMPTGTNSIQLPSPPKEALIGFRSRGRLTPTATQLLQSFFQLTDETLHRILPLNRERLRPRISFLGEYFEESIEPIVYGFWYMFNVSNLNSTLAGSLSPGQLADCANILPGIFDYQKMAIPDDPIPAMYKPLIIDKQDIKEFNFENGRVSFNEPVFFNDATLGRVPPPLRLRCSFPIRDPDTMAAICPQFWYSPGGVNAASVAKLLKDSTYGLEYSAQDSTNSAFDNAELFLAWSQGIIQKEIWKYSMVQGQSIPYNTFVFNIQPDGIAKAISWAKAESGEGTTHIDYGLERPSFYLTLNERRLKRMQTYNLAVTLDEEKRARRGYGAIKFGAKSP